MSYFSCPVCGLFAEHSSNGSWWTCSECKTEWMAHQVVIRKSIAHPVPAMIALRDQCAEAERQQDELVKACNRAASKLNVLLNSDPLMLDTTYEKIDLIRQMLASAKGGE